MIQYSHLCAGTRRPSFPRVRAFHTSSLAATSTRRWLSALIFAAALLQGITVVAQLKTTPSPTPSTAIPVVKGDSLVLFVSDAQGPLFVEEAVLKANNNNKAREIIFNQMLADHANAIFTLGDMASLGFYQSTWKSFDNFLSRARVERVPVFATLGNHELMIYPSFGAEEFNARFPWYIKTGYSVRVGKLAVAMLNSNYSQLSDEEESQQVEWLDSTLAAFEADSSVSTVIVACHHPPFTNSTIVTPSEEVLDEFVPLYLQYSKCRLFLSGHCHAFEHFHQEGKDFLVLGGGGGLQQPLLIGKDAIWEDLFPRKTEIRMFHYLQCRLVQGVLHVTVKMLKPDFTGFEDAYELALPPDQLSKQ
jgi:3',5'-cyclic AMP phosphodiesterase CpdA